MLCKDLVSYTICHYIRAVRITLQDSYFVEPLSLGIGVFRGTGFLEN
jgi:hypothetical protein